MSGSGFSHLAIFRVFFVFCFYVLRFRSHTGVTRWVRCPTFAALGLFCIFLCRHDYITPKQDSYHMQPISQKWKSTNALGQGIEGIGITLSGPSLLPCCAGQAAPVWMSRGELFRNTESVRHHSNSSIALTWAWWLWLWEQLAVRPWCFLYFWMFSKWFLDALCSLTRLIGSSVQAKCRTLNAKSIDV